MYIKNHWGLRELEHKASQSRILLNSWTAVPAVAYDGRTFLGENPEDSGGKTFGRI
jgi:hypothetical protein